MDAEKLAEEVFQKRRKLRISQGKLAQLADISRNYVSLIERGEAHNVSVNVINNLATALQTTPGELIGETAQTSILIPPSLREFGLEAKLSFDVVDRLARIPRRGQEPQSAEEWQQLYEAIKPYLA